MPNRAVRFRRFARQNWAALVVVAVLTISMRGNVDAQLYKPDYVPPRGSATQDVSLLTPQIVLQRVHVKVGEPILLNVNVRNDSPHSLDVNAGIAAWHAVKLSVIGPDGKQILPGLQYLGGDGTSGLQSIAPGASLYPSNPQVWVSLDHWSYELRVPGHYTILARAAVRGPLSVNVQREGSATTSFYIDP
jgi:hypothetical protein